MERFEHVDMLGMCGDRVASEIRADHVAAMGHWRELS
jgi:hypothetical protein